ncbi:hypothetical protein HLK59_13620 [Streptomyces sp. S3(2020)]|nr:hypothetical protein [Streptomyces sp. S3(2020)]NNN31386.1 hypothetical protein [Streptomyces sp. S3(2020)]
MPEQRNAERLIPCTTSWDTTRWSDEHHALGLQHDVLREAIGDELDRPAS